MYRAYGVYARPPRPPSPPRDPLSPTYAPLYSTRGLSTRTRLNIHRFTALGWTPYAVADREGCGVGAVYNVIKNVMRNGSTRKPIEGTLGRKSTISFEDGEALFDEPVRSGWMYQDEIVRWLLLERGLSVSQSTISRYLKKQR